MIEPENDYSIPRYADPSILAFDGFDLETMSMAANKTIWSDFDQSLLSTLEFPKMDLANGWSAPKIVLYLNRCRDHVERLIRDLLAESYTDVRWLWYLRRLPRFLLAGRLPTTYSYDLALAEVVTDLYAPRQASEPFLDGEQISFRMDESAVRHLCRLCAAVKFLSQIHVAIRYSGKGVNFARVQQSAIPQQQPTQEQQYAIALYDERHARSGMPFSRVGTAVVDFSGCRSDASFATIAMAEQQWSRAVHGPLIGEHKEVEVFSSFRILQPTFDQLAELNRKEDLAGIVWWPPEIGPLLLLLSLMFSCLAVLSHALITLLRNGYFWIQEDLFSRLVDERLFHAASRVTGIFPGVQMPTSSAMLISSLESMASCTWPLRMGRPIRRAGRRLMVDLYGASALLNNLLEFPKLTGAPPNARSHHFELAVQNQINNTKWSPPTQLGKLRGLPLTHQGDAITDIDAIGYLEAEKILLAVSCKSMIYSSLYDAGDYQAVRNARTLVEESVPEWLDKIEFLRNNKLGDNYDFSEVLRFVPVVCTPFVVFTPIGLATREIYNGLRHAVSFSEISAWLAN